MYERVGQFCDYSPKGCSRKRTPLHHEPLRPRLRVRSARATKIIVKPLDVVLTEVVPMLDFDEHQVVLTEVRDPVGCLPGDVDGIAPVEARGSVVEDHLGGTSDNEPVLGPSGMALVAESAPGSDLDPLQLVSWGVLEDREGSPRAVVAIASHHPSLAHGAGPYERPLGQGTVGNLRASRSRCWGDDFPAVVPSNWSDGDGH